MPLPAAIMKADAMKALARVIVMVVIADGKEEGRSRYGWLCSVWQL